MPNHTTNILYVSGPRADLEKFRDTVSGNNPALIANLKATLEANIAKNQTKLLTHPKDVWAAQEIKNDQGILDKINNGTYEGNDLDFEGTVPMPASMHITSPAQTEEEKRIADDNLRKYGCKDWHDYTCKFWGTKWNAYEVEEVEVLEDQLIYRFQTAWSPPEAWIYKTSELFPTLTFRLAAADEGGYYYVDYTYQNGDRTEEHNMECHDWRMEFEPNYKEVYEAIFSVGYDEGIKRAMEMGSIDYSLEHELLKFIKDDDLPLFSSFDWDTSAGDLYSERIKLLDQDAAEKAHEEKKRIAREQAKKND